MRTRALASRALVPLVVLVAVVGLSACTVNGSLSGDDGDLAPADITALVAATPAYRAHPPDGGPVVVDESLRGWRSMVWLSADDQFCSGSVDIVGRGRGDLAFNCWLPVTDEVFADGAPPVSLPAFQALPTPFDSGDRVLVIGLARADVATVEFTFRSAAVSVPTKTLAAAGSTLSVYAAWLPLNGATAYGSNEITSLRGRDAAGTPVN
jgi:hypothetical protein